LAHRLLGNVRTMQFFDAFLQGVIIAAYAMQMICLSYGKGVRLSHPAALSKRRKLGSRMTLTDLEMPF